MVTTKSTAWYAKLAHISLPILAVVAAPLILLGWSLVQGQVLFWGTPSLQFVPWWLEAWVQFRSGVVPLWNDLSGMGAPLAANYQSAFFYPPNWLLLACAAIGGAQAIAWGYTLLAMLHLIWAGLGMVVLMRRFGAGELAQAVSGLAFGMSGYLLGRLEFFSMVWVAAWLPWIIRYADEVASPVFREENTGIKSRLPVQLIVALGMQFLAGHAQLSWYSILLMGVWVLSGAIKGGIRKITGAVIRLFAAGLLAVGLAAVQLLPTAEYLTQSQRADEVDYDFAMTYSFWPWRFVTVIAPDFFGNPGQGDYWGYASYWEDHLYFGMPAFLLAFSTIPFMLKRKQEKIKAWHKSSLALLAWGIVIVAFVFALGRNTPVFPFVFKYIPTFDMFQAPARYLLWATFAMAILAGLGADRWRCPEKKGLYWLRLGTMGMFAVTLGAGIAWQTMGDVRLTFIRATALAGGWALGTGIFTLVLPIAEKYGRRNLWSLGVIAWLAADLLVASWVLNPTVGVDLYGASRGVIQEIKPKLQTGRLYISEFALDDLKFKRFFRFQDFTPVEDWRNIRDTALPNLNLLDRVPSANNFDPLLPGRYVRWMETLQILDDPIWQNWLAWMNVRLVEQIDVGEPGGVKYVAVDGGKMLWWYSCAQIVQDEETGLSILKLSEGNERLIIESDTSGLETTCTQKVPVEIKIGNQGPGRLRFIVDSQSAGWLMVSQTWYPGWRARVDGLETTLFRANYLFMGISIPAGKHEVDLLYQPYSFVFGLLLSILVVVGLLAWRLQWHKHLFGR